MIKSHTYRPSPTWPGVGPCPVDLSKQVQASNKGWASCAQDSKSWTVFFLRKYACLRTFLCKWLHPKTLRATCQCPIGASRSRSCKLTHLCFEAFPCLHMEPIHGAHLIFDGCGLISVWVALHLEQVFLFLVYPGLNRTACSLVPEALR